VCAATDRAICAGAFQIRRDHVKFLLGIVFSLALLISAHAQNPRLRVGQTIFFKTSNVYGCSRLDTAQHVERLRYMKGKYEAQLLVRTLNTDDVTNMCLTFGAGEEYEVTRIFDNWGGPFMVCLRYTKPYSVTPPSSESETRKTIDDNNCGWWTAINLPSLF
jgi:hypothetical protein